MKRTTYFIIAMIASGFILALAVLAYISTTEIDQKHRTVLMDGDILNNNTECFNEVCITETKQGILARYITRNFEISIKKDSLISEPSITFNSDWKEYIDFNVENNILHVNFNLIKLLDDAKYVTVESQPITISIPTPIKAIDGNISDSHINVNGFNCDSVTLAAEARIKISNCRFNYLNIANSHSTYYYNSAIGTIRCDLAACGDWNFDDKSTINTIIATGNPSYGNFADLQDINFKEFYWIPTDSTESLTEIRVNFPVKITRQ